MKKIIVIILACLTFAATTNAQKSSSSETPSVSILIPETHKSASTDIVKTTTLSTTKNEVVYNFTINQGADGKLVSIKFTSKDNAGIQKINEYNASSSLQESGGTCKDCYNKCKMAGQSNWECLIACVLDNCMNW